MGILKGIDPLLTAELLYVLRSAGHGDVIAVVDANFPAASTAVDTDYEESIVLAGASLPDALAAISSVLPLDLFIEEPVGVMVPSEGLTMPPLAVEVQKEAIAAIEANSGEVVCEEVERFDFYDRAREPRHDPENACAGVRDRAVQRAPAVRLLPAHQGCCWPRRQGSEAVIADEGARRLACGAPRLSEVSLTATIHTGEERLWTKRESGRAGRGV
eukprot:1133735-Prymnesium_polylepis.2